MGIYPIGSGRRRMRRRTFLELGAGAAASGLVAPLVGCDFEPEGLGNGIGVLDELKGPERLPPDNWLQTARIGGLEIWSQISDRELWTRLSAHAAQRVSVVELDSMLSFYLTDEDFEEELRAFDRAARGAHALGMRAVAYYPTLELLTSNVEEKAHSAAKDHPEWLQKDLFGRENVFVGGSGRAFWVPEGTESAWLCPTSTYAEHFLNRVQRLSSTALDGLWADVPLFSDLALDWTCGNDTCRARFKADTGQDLPTDVDWSDPAFRRWVHWRHAIMHEFQQRILSAARSMRTDFEVIVETVTMDYSGCTAQGLDGASHEDGELVRVWEVDAVSDETAMSRATAADWISMAVMMRHGAGCSWPRASWSFCYGKNPADAERVFGLAVVTRCQPFELLIPEMTRSVGAHYRTRVFAWLAKHPDIFTLDTWRPVAVIYSSASRNYLDRNEGVGLYTSADPDDPLWWATFGWDMATALPYVSDYRGVCRALMDAHVPYEVLIGPRLDAAGLARYQLALIPSPLALSEDQIEALLAWVEGGGTLIVTGPDGGLYDVDGTAREIPLLLERLALRGAAARPTPAWSTQTHGRGQVRHHPERAGRPLLSGDHHPADLPTELEDALTVVGRRIETDAPAGLLMDLRRASDGSFRLVCANIVGLGAKGIGDFNPRDVTFRVALDLDGFNPERIVLSAPGESDVTLPHTPDRARVTFELTVAAVAVAVIG